MLKKRYFVLILFMVAFSSCKRKHGELRFRDISELNEIAGIEIKHAKGFSVSEINGITRLSVLDPWQGARNISYDYYLIEKGQSPPPGISPLQVIKVPVQNIVCLSTTHIGFIDLLGETEKIIAIAGGNYVSNPLVIERLESGLIKDIGYDQNLNYEMLVKLKPDVVMVYGIGSETTGYLNKLKELGIKVIFNAEYLEETALGKAEWLKFTAYLFQKKDLAEELFSEIEREYFSLRELTSKIPNRPGILINLPWKGSWHMAGGKSFFAEMIRDAGGSYLWEENTAKESFPVDIEIVFQRAKQADIWLNAGNANSINDILAEDSRLKVLSPLKAKRVFNNNARLSSLGGNDYWEKGITEPQVILKDLIHIIHPELLPSHQLVYYKKLD
jgi:iron complex transport system substrate-binding protein